MSRHINDAGLELIKAFEGFRAYPYRDSAGIWTIGYGHTRDVDTWTTPINEEQAEDFLREDVEDAEADVVEAIKVLLDDNQFAALVSLVYNAGPAPLTHTLGTLLNLGNYAATADEFPKWNKANGVVSPGLSRRRNAERILFLS